MAPYCTAVINHADLPSEENSVVTIFLAFLQKDMMARPERITALDAGLMEHAQALVSDVEIDLDAPLEEDE